MTEALFIALGLAFGSFGTVLVTRLPAGMHVRGRSQCRACLRSLQSFELIPVVSFLLLRGKCRTCGSPIGWMHPLVETASAALFLFAWLHHNSVIPATLLALALWVLLLIAVIDLRTQTISDFLNFTLLIFGIAHGLSQGRPDMGGLLLGGGFFGLLWIVSRGRWIGSGDVILGLGIGALVGSFGRMAACLFFTYIFGALIVAFLLITGKCKRKTYVAFAPFLALGTFFTVAFGTRIDVLLQIYFGM